MKSLTTPPRTGHRTLLYSELVTELEGLKSDIAVLGMPFGSPYSARSFSNDQTNAPQAIRDMTDRMVRAPEHYDFDIDGPLLQGRTDVRFVDCGDVIPDLNVPGDHLRRCEEAVRHILKGGGLPIVLGGDHGITNPVLRGFDGVGDITLVHIDAHLDWRDEVNGVRDGLSSPIRRASELPFVKHIVQIGLRAQGSGRPADYHAAREWGATLVTAYELHEIGMKAVLDRIPDGGNYYLSIDADGMDPTVMPAVAVVLPWNATVRPRRCRLRPGAPADPRPREEGARGGDGHRRDPAGQGHADQTHLRHRRPPHREPHWDYDPRRLLRQVTQPFFAPQTSHPTP